jgi:hypothetical protein
MQGDSRTTVDRIDGDRYAITFDSTHTFALTASEFESLARQIVDRLQVHVLAEPSSRKVPGVCIVCGKPYSPPRICEACRPSSSE